MEKEKKIRDKFLINLSSRNPESIAKFSNWLDVQTNPQSSFLAMIEHSIDRFGYVDVMDHEVSKKMHTEYLYFNNDNVMTNNIQKSEMSELTVEVENNSNKDNLSTPKELNSKKTINTPKINGGAF